MTTKKSAKKTKKAKAYAFLITRVHAGDPVPLPLPAPPPKEIKLLDSSKANAGSHVATHMDGRVAQLAPLMVPIKGPGSIQHTLSVANGTLPTIAQLLELAQTTLIEQGVPPKFGLESETSLPDYTAGGIPHYWNGERWVQDNHVATRFSAGFRIRETATGGRNKSPVNAKCTHGASDLKHDFLLVVQGDTAE